MTVPHARLSKPWSGPPTDGNLYLHEGAQGSAVLCFDRDGVQHAVTYFDASIVGDQIVWGGRIFDVVRTDPQPEVKEQV